MWLQVDVLEYYEHQIRSAYDIHFIPAVLRVIYFIPAVLRVIHFIPAVLRVIYFIPAVLRVIYSSNGVGCVCV